MYQRHAHRGSEARPIERRRPYIAYLLWLAVCFVHALHSQPAHAETDKGHGEPWSGVYTLNRMLTFYVVNSTGEAFDVSIRWNSTWQAQSDIPVLVRVLNPDEQEVARHLDRGLKSASPPTWTHFSVPVASGAPGVYQVIVTGSCYNVDFGIEPALSWGVYGYPYLQGEDHLTDAYVFLPPNLNSLTISTQGTADYVRLTDADGITHINISGASTAGYCALPPGDNQVWRLSAQAPNELGLTFGVAPIIACPDEATALAIASSVEVLADGTVCFHKFQVAAHELLEQYAQMDPSAYAVSPPPLSAQESLWTANPPRNSLLLGWYGVYSALPATLAEQNLDPASPWFGSIRVWHDSNGAELPNPWVTYNRNSMVDPAPTIGVLAAVHGIEDSINPLHHNANLRNRVIVAALRQMMMLREHELPESTHLTYDGGEKAFTFARMTRAFPWVVQQCPGDVQAVWIAGMRRYVDHMALATVPEIANQWSFIMMGLQSFAKATGEQTYRDYVQMHIDWLLQRRMFGYGAMPAGYFSEGEGPDATYAGMNMHFLAWLCEEVGSEPLKQAVLKSFTLYNHTVAPEPDGTWLGASSFSYRTPGDWTNPQFTAGVSILADDSADAAVMLGRTMLCWKPATNAAQTASQQTVVQNLLPYYPENVYSNPDIGPCIADGPMIPMVLWEHFMSTPVAGAQLPMKADTQFTRKFGDEFFAVRRPSYYAFLYCGKTFAQYRQPQRPSDPNVQYPRNGGGLSMLWSSKFGSSILAKNWSAYATNSIIAVKGGNTYFEDYWFSDGALQTAQSRATIDGKLTDGKMTFRRQLTFAEDRINCEIRLQRPQAVTFNHLWECFPYPLDKPDPVTVTLYDAEGKKINGNNKIASAIVFSNDTNDVHIIAFKQPRKCEFGSNTSTDAYGGIHEYGRVLSMLPLEWNANQVRTVKWTARAVNKNQITPVIKQMVAALQ